MDDDDVGYKKPPRQHQFQPGQSGNVGRRKVEEPIDAEKLLGAPVSIIRNGRKMAVDPRHLALESQFNYVDSKPHAVD